MSTWLIFLDCDRFFLDFAIEYVRRQMILFQGDLALHL